MFDVALVNACVIMFIYTAISPFFVVVEKEIVSRFGYVSGQMCDCSRSESCGCVQESWHFKRARCQWLGMPGVW